MRTEIYPIKNPADSRAIKKFWIKAFAVYALAEVIFLGATYFITYSQCPSCVLPFPFYLWQYLANLLLTAMFWYGLAFFYKQALWKAITANILIFFLYYFIYAGMLYVVLNSGQEWLMGKTLRYRSFQDVVYNSWFDIGKYVVKLSAFYVLRFYAEYRKAASQRLELAVINKDMQLNLLKQQLNPHFYFNTLNNLYGLSRNNHPKLPAALSQLSDIMRYVITDCNQHKVSLDQEINFLHSYIELEKLRYENDTIIEFDVQGDAGDQQIIPLLLIQFVENAFKHGMKEKSKNDWMKVSTAIVDNELAFRVSNSNYSSLPTGGIGISSVKNILELQYQGKYELQMQQEDHCFSVTLKLSL
ncbi:MAG: sensor histidine kinase [Chitinophagaceae bacterium]|jgi:sensor histidine kinase YesM|nr:sensor histidine kinase [Chitinophagaceae bacterium]